MGKYQKTKYPGVFKYVGRRGEVYGIDYYAGGKKHREIVGPLLTEAREKLEEQRKSGRDGRYMSLAARRKFTFGHLAHEYEEKQKGEIYFDKTRKYYVPIFKEFFGERKLCQIGPLEIENFKKKRKATPTKAGKERLDVAVNRELETLRHMLYKAVEWEMMTENPFTKFRDSILYDEDESRIRYLTEDEIKRLFAALDGKPAGKNQTPGYLRHIIMAALLTGLRKSDLLALKWSDVDLEKGILIYTEKKKKSKRRVKQLNSDMVKLLRSLPRGEGENIFRDADGKPLKDIKRSFRSLLKRAGIKDFHFHDLRHTSASYMVMRGASLKAVQEHLGHTSLAMTQKYAHLSPEFQKAEIERLNGVFSVGPVSSKNLVRNDQNVDLSFETGIHANA